MRGHKILNILYSFNKFLFGISHLFCLIFIFSAISSGNLIFIIYGIFTYISSGAMLLFFRAIKHHDDDIEILVSRISKLEDKNYSPTEDEFNETLEK